MGLSFGRGTHEITVKNIKPINITVITAVGCLAIFPNVKFLSFVKLIAFTDGTTSSSDKLNDVRCYSKWRHIQTSALRKS